MATATTLPEKNIKLSSKAYDTIVHAGLSTNPDDKRRILPFEGKQTVMQELKRQGVISSEGTHAKTVYWLNYPLDVLTRKAPRTTKPTTQTPRATTPVSRSAHGSQYPSLDLWFAFLRDARAASTDIYEREFQGIEGKIEELSQSLGRIRSTGERHQIIKQLDTLLTQQQVIGPNSAIQGIKDTMAKAEYRNYDWHISTNPEDYKGEYTG